MISIQLNKPGELDVQLAFPTNWNEMRPAEILHSAKAMISGLQPEQVRASILLFMIDARAKLEKQKLPKKWKELIDPEQFFLEGSGLLDFLFKENLLTMPPENTIQLAGTRTYTVHAPLKGFSSLTCGEFEDAGLYYTKFLQEQKPEHLAMLAAIIWRPKGTSYHELKGGKLETYPAERWAKLFMRLEPHRLYAIFIWFTGCNGMLPKVFPTMHESDRQEDATPDPLAFTKCIHAGAGPKNGTRNQIRLMNINEFLFDMEQEAIKAKELKAQYDAAGK